MLVETGGNDLTAIVSPAVADVQIFVIDVAGGDDTPRKGGPGLARADLLVINKTDLAPFVGSDVGLMLSDATARRGTLPVLAVSLRTPPRALTSGGLGASAAARLPRRRRAAALECPRRQPRARALTRSGRPAAQVR